MAQYRYQQAYYQRLRAQQQRMLSQRYNYANDPYFYTPDSYQYSYGGNEYQTNQYGAQLLRQAANDGYAEGIRAGQADRQDGWRQDYRNAFAYQDANYGYDGYYVSQRDYNYYFRQGFRRGYDDGYNQDYRYGRYDQNNNTATLLQTVLGLILNLQPLG
jgi:flagellar biosynthesis/type III secretory pathway protein FliH